MTAFTVVLYVTGAMVWVSWVATTGAHKQVVAKHGAGVTLVVLGLTAAIWWVLFWFLLVWQTAVALRTAGAGDG